MMYLEKLTQFRYDMILIYLTERDRDRQTDRQRGRQTGGQTERERERDL